MAWEARSWAELRDLLRDFKVVTLEYVLSVLWRLCASALRAAKKRRTPVHLPMKRDFLNFKHLPAMVMTTHK